MHLESKSYSAFDGFLCSELMELVGQSVYYISNNKTKVLQIKNVIQTIDTKFQVSFVDSDGKAIAVRRCNPFDIDRQLNKSSFYIDFAKTRIGFGSIDKICNIRLPDNMIYNEFADRIYFRLLGRSSEYISCLTNIENVLNAEISPEHVNIVENMLKYYAVRFGYVEFVPTNVVALSQFNWIRNNSIPMLEFLLEHIQKPTHEDSVFHKFYKYNHSNCTSTKKIFFYEKYAKYLCNIIKTLVWEENNDK